MELPQLPEGLVHVRSTAVFDSTSAPAGLRRAHQVASGVWARLVVRTGALALVFDDLPDQPIELGPGDAAAIPPMRSHHVDLSREVTFVVEFHRSPESAPPAAGRESTGLLPQQ